MCGGGGGGGGGGFVGLRAVVVEEEMVVVVVVVMEEAFCGRAVLRPCWPAPGFAFFVRGAPPYRGER